MTEHSGAERNNIGKWFAKSVSWRVPVYQRHYAWQASDDAGPIHSFWETIKEQTEKRLRNEEPSPHYLGAVIVDHKSDDKSAALDGVTVYDVVDGQQRLTTIQIALAALIKTAIKFDYGDEVKNNLKEYMVIPTGETIEPKLKPTNFDERQFMDMWFDVYRNYRISDDSRMVEENAKKSKVWETFLFFLNEFEAFIEDAPYSEYEIIGQIQDTLIKGFEIIVIILNKTDNPQRIFASLNSFAKPLTTFDLIRNDVLYRAGERAKEIFKSDTWQSFEQPYWEKASSRQDNPATHIEAYIARMLVSNQKKEVGFNRPAIVRTYEIFSKQFSDSIDREVEELSRYTKVYKYLDGEEGAENPISPEFDFGVFSHKVWRNRDFYPVIFSIYRSNASVEEKQRMIKLLESYVIRRGVTASSRFGSSRPLSTANYNQYAPVICRELGENPSYEKLNHYIKLSQSDSSLFPNDAKVQHGCEVVRFYGSNFSSYIFEHIEDSLHDVSTERMFVKEGTLTVDHILPQSWETNEEWKNMVVGGENDRDDHLRNEFVVSYYLDTIGNLTLMSKTNNSRKSNRSFDECKKLLSASSVNLNRRLAAEKSWDVEKIIERGKWIADKICEIWPYDIK